MTASLAAGWRDSLQVVTDACRAACHIGYQDRYGRPGRLGGNMFQSAPIDYSQYRCIVRRATKWQLS